MRWIIAMVLPATLAIGLAGPAEDAKTANRRGMTLYAAKDYAGAAKQFRAAIAAQPSFVLAHYNLASMAALLGDKPTVLAELKWLHDSSDPAARKALDKAPTDPDLKSVIDDPEVRALVMPDCSSTCSRELDDKCGARCNDRACMRSCEQLLDDCTSGCKLGMNAEARARMRAWIAGPLSGHDNDMAKMRDARIDSNLADGDLPRFTVTIKNQFGFQCAVEWAPDGAPASLGNCVATDKAWTASPATIPVKCALDRKHKVDRCEGGFTLSKDSYSDDGRFVLERAFR